jgi:hypothetical protein
MKSRIFSGIVAAGYVMAAYLTLNGEATLLVGLFLILPLACIWFSDAMGDYLGGMDPAITRTTPGWAVAFGGWLLLLLPIIIWSVLGVAGSTGNR